MFDRAKIIDQNIKSFLSAQVKVSSYSHLEKLNFAVTDETIIDLFESQLISRYLDIKARKLKAQGKSFYTIGSSGHEGMAVVGLVSRITDMAFLHYRDCALLVQRSKKNPGHTIIYDLLLSFCASSEDPITAGRHKALGSLELNIPPQTSTIASHLPKAIGAALSLQKIKKLGITGHLPEDAVIVCTFGDASLNHASAQSALNTAEWLTYQQIPLPLVFVCEDNGIGISVITPQNWVRHSRQNSEQIKYYECDGTDLVESLNIVTSAFAYSRRYKKPSFIRFKTVRLMGHAGSDIENVYLSPSLVEKNEAQDPIIKSIHTLIGNGLCTHSEILEIILSLEKRIDKIADDVIQKSKIENSQTVIQSIVPTKIINPPMPIPNDEERKSIFGNDWEQMNNKQSLAKLINMGLTDILLQYKSAVIFGEDVAKKGGVYNVTANLENRFGKNKVFNSLLDETNILGSAIGMAHNKVLPIPEIQFLAYFHNAEDQIRGEAATLSFFSNGQYTNGMVVRIAGLAYQKGFGGHFHNDNSLAVLRDIPGIIIACPSNGEDAVKMMRTCVEQAHCVGRITIFIEPIALYPIKDLHAKDDALWSGFYPKNLKDKIELGEFHFEENDKQLCILTYGNGYYLSKQAEKILQQLHHIHPSLIDLRWIAPLNKETLAATLSQFKHVLVVEECRETGSLSEGLITLMVERCSPLPKMGRVCSLDSFIPLAEAANLVLVQTEDIVRDSLKLLGKVHE